MSSSSGGGDVIGAALDRLDAACDAVAALSCAGLSGAEVLAVLERLERLRCRQPTIEHRLTYELTSREHPAELGAKNWPEVLGQRLNIGGTEARRRLDEAAELGPRRAMTGQPQQPTLPTVAARQGAGDINTEHIRVIRRFFNELPAAVDYETRELCEQTLATVAAENTPAALRRAAQRLAALVNPDGDFTDIDRARRRYVTIRRQGPDGMSRLDGLLDPQARATLEAVLAKLAAPGVANPDDQSPCLDEAPSPDRVTRDTRSQPQRNHDALTTAARAVLASGTLGQHQGLPATIIVSTTLTELQSASGTALTAGGALLPMRDVIRLAAHAQHYLAVFDEHTTIPLYLGRARRTAAPGQRIVLHATDRGCTFPGCTAPGYACQAHHLTDWATGGPTTIDNLTFACGPHNRLATTGGWTTRKRQDGRTEWIPPPNLDRGQTHINNYHHPQELLIANDEDHPSDESAA